MSDGGLSLPPYARATLAGVAAGLRSLAPPAFVGIGGRRLPALLLGVGALAELIGDKLPSAPSRLGPGPLVLRVASGGYAGAYMVWRFGGSRRAGIALGAMGAVVGAIGGYSLRRAIGRWLRVPDLTVALAEDLVALALIASLKR